MSRASAAWMWFVASLGCVVCRRAGTQPNGIELHHVAEGSGKRSDFAVAPLCPEHHRGASGFHGQGSRAFCSAYRVPGETEYGLLVWTAEDAAKALLARGAL